MPAEYALLDDPCVLLTTYRGVVTDREFVALYEAALNDPAYVLGCHEFADLRAVDAFRVSTDALRQVVHITQKRYRGASETFRSAVIVADDLAYAIGRMYEVLSEGSPEGMRVFHTVREGLDWLGLGDPEFVARLETGGP